MNIFAYDFMQRALLGVLITGLSAPALGIYLVQRRMALIGDGIGHIALTGLGLALLTGSAPVLTAVVVSAAGAVAVELIRERGKASGDIALALLFYGGISGGVFLVALSSGRTNTNLMAYLFGSPLTTSAEDLMVMAVLGAVVLAVTLLLRPWLFAICQDEEYARVAGLPVRSLNILLAITTAVNCARFSLSSRCTSKPTTSHICTSLSAIGVAPTIPSKVTAPRRIARCAKATLMRRRGGARSARGVEPAQARGSP